METKFTEQESLAIIDEMINRARNNIQKGSANSLIYNGYVVAIVALLNFLLIHILPYSERNMSFWIWMLMLPSAVIDHFIGRKLDRSSTVKTQIDGIITWLWRGFGISTTLLVIIVMAVIIVYKNAISGLLITPVIMLFVAIVEFGMAKATNFKPFYWGAICFWAGTILCLLSYVILKRGDLHFLVLAACMVAGFIIPGYILNRKAKENV
jgi:hypothetical protein